MTDNQTADDTQVMRVWRECGLPEYFLGNGGTNHKLLAFVQRIYDTRRERLRTHMDEAKREAEELHGTGATFQEGHVWGYFDGLEWAFRNDLGLSNAEDEWWDRHYPPVKT